MLARNIKLLTWFNFFVDFRFYFPIAILYFAKITGSYALGMSIFGFTQLAQALFEIPTGVFSDYIGRKKTVIFGAFFSILAVFFYALGFSYWILIIGAVLEGVSRSFYSGNNDAFLHESLSEERKEDEYHTYYGKLSSMFQIAAGFAVFLGGIIAFYSFSLTFWLSVIPQVFCLMIAFNLVEPKVISKQTSNIYNHLKESLILFIKNPKLRLLSFSDIYSFGLGEAGYQFRSAFINMVWPVWAIGIPQVLSSFGAAIGFFHAGKIIKKYGGVKVLLLTSIYDKVIGIISLTFVSVFSPLLMTTTSFNFGLSTTAKSSLMQKEFTDSQRATMSSLNSLAGSLFFAFVAYLIGFVADKFNPAQALLVITIFSLLNVWVYWKLFKHK